jgi:nicotinamide-nucleotide amidase
VNVNHVLIKRLAVELGKRDATVTVAESCTGGWIAKHLTDIPGSSDWFEYGFVSYGNNAKQTLLGVTSDVLETHGAVSKETAEAMVNGALEKSGAELALAVTGIAGPDGGTADKPVGTVWMAWCLRGHTGKSEGHHFNGDRDTVRRLTVTTALRGVLEYLEQTSA